MAVSKNGPFGGCSKKIGPILLETPICMYWQKLVAFSISERARLAGPHLESCESTGIRETVNEAPATGSS